MPTIPINQNVIVKPIPIDKMVGSLYVPEDFERDHMEHRKGEIVAVSEDCDEWYRNMPAGTVVLYESVFGVEVPGMPELLIMDQKRIKAKVVS